MAAIRQDIIQYVTDRPGQVVTKDDIMAHGGWSASQVTSAIRTAQSDSPIGDEIETIVRGNAWRFVPRRPITAATTGDSIASNPTLPLTTLIREYLVDNPRRVVSLDELVRYTGREPYQVQVGVNNMRRIASNADVASYLDVVTHGRLWRFNPPTNWQPGRQPSHRPTATTSTRPVTTSPTTGRPTAAVPATAVVVEPPSSPNGQVATADEDGDGDGNVRVFEEVGSLRDGRLVIRDQDGNMYAAVPMN